MKPNVVDVKASELLKNGKVAVRVADLQQQAAARNDMSVDNVISGLLQTHQEAREANRHGAAIW